MDSRFKFGFGWLEEALALTETSFESMVGVEAASAAGAVVLNMTFEIVLN